MTNNSKNREIKFFCQITKKWETLVISKPYKNTKEKNYD